MFAKELTISQWIQLPNEERLLMRELFSIPRTGGSVMLDGRLQTDGHTAYDLKAVSTEAMQKFLDTASTDWDELLKSTIMEMRNILASRKLKEEQKVKAERDDNLNKTISAMITPILNSVKQLPPEGQIALRQEIDTLLAPFAGSAVKEPTKEYVEATKGTRKGSKGKVNVE